MYTVRQAVVATTSVSTLVGHMGCRGPYPGIGDVGAPPSPPACGATPPNGWAWLDTPWAITYDYPTRSHYVLESTRLSRVE